MSIAKRLADSKEQIQTYPKHDLSWIDVCYVSNRLALNRLLDTDRKKRKYVVNTKETVRLVQQVKR